MTNEAKTIRDVLEEYQEQNPERPGPRVALEALAALTSPPTPEDVVADAQRLLNAMQAFSEPFASELTARITRLRDWASRAKTLEMQSAADRYAIHGVLMWAGEWPLGVETMTPTRHVSAVLKRLSDAESERDAARQEVDAAMKRGFESAAETLSEVLDDDPTAPGGFIADASGHVLRCSPDLPARWKSLRERVATLEAETSRCAKANELLNEVWLAEKSRAEAAERKMAELERERDDAVENERHATACMQEALDDARRYREACEPFIRAARILQKYGADGYKPIPDERVICTAEHGEDVQQVTMRDFRALLALDAPTGPSGREKATCPECESEQGHGLGCSLGHMPSANPVAEPTPAPAGLMEAVGFIVEQVRLSDDVHVLPDASLMAIRITAGQGRAIAAAYDAAQSAPSVPMCAHCDKAPATCRGFYEGHGSESYACDDCCGHGNEDGRCEPIDSANPTPTTAGLLEAAEKMRTALMKSRPTHAQWPRSHAEHLRLIDEALAAYDAARGCGPCSDGECQTHPHNDHGDAAKAEPSVPLATLAAVVEEYVESCAGAEKTGQRVGAREVLRRMSSGPVPEVLTKARVTEAVHVFTETGIHTRPARTSGMGVGGMEAMIEAENRRPARMTPPPATPLVTRSTHTDRTCGACNGPLETSRDAVCETCAPESTAHITALSMAPTAPKVVWEGDGVRVEQNWSGVTVGSSGSLSSHTIIHILARALAEAKREVRKAAEDMRERAAEAANTARHFVVIDETFGTYKRACEDIAIRIRAIPLPGDTNAR